MVSEGPCSASAAAALNETHQVVRAYSSIEKTGKRVPVRCRVLLIGWLTCMCRTALLEVKASL